MTDKEIEKFIDELCSQKNMKEAYIGYFQYGGGPDESFIKANRQGLEVQAAELLKAALKTENTAESGEIDNLGFDDLIPDENSEIFFHYIQVTHQVREDSSPNEESQNTWKDKMFQWGCLGALFSLIALVIIGLVTVISWI